MVAAFDTGRVDDVAAFVDDDYIDHQGLHGEEVRGAAGSYVSSRSREVVLTYSLSASRT